MGINLAAQIAMICVRQRAADLAAGARCHTAAQMTFRSP
jgi:hypothetical protein